MKPKKDSEYEINNNNNRYHNINIDSMSTKGLTLNRENKSSNSQWIKNKTMKTSKDDKVSKRKFPRILTSESFYNTANLYLNKNNYIFRKKIKKNKYFEKEQLFDRVIKLQTALNTLNQKYNKQKIQNKNNQKKLKNKINF